jgi:hypothetical protein
MTTLTTTNPQDAKMADTSDNSQDVRLALSKLASRGAPDPAPAPELNGYLLKHPEKPEIYLILNGQRRLIPNVETVNGLFVTNRTVHEDFHIELITKGDDIAAGATLVKGDGADPWYLLAGGKVKMWIRDAKTFAQYQFRAVSTVAQILINSIPDGPDVAGRAK